MTRRLLCVILAVLFAPALAFAQQGIPPRDAVRRVTPVGTSAIDGVVLVDDDKAKGLRRARVTVTSAELPGGRTVITRDDGRYRIEGLPAGRYTLRATKDGYVAMAFGARRSTSPGTSIAIGEGQTATRINVRLPRGAVIGGMVLDPDGQPVVGAAVRALSWRFLAGVGERRLMPSGVASTTDDRGEYRIFGLPAGEYIVGAAAHGPNTSDAGLQVISDAEIRRALADLRPVQSTRSKPGIAPPPPATAPVPPAPRAVVSYAPVYFPGTTDVGTAVLVPLRRAEERVGTDITIDYVPTARISGFVTGMSDRPGTDIVVQLSPAERAIASEGMRMTRVRSGGGEFSFATVPPGRYVILARSAGAVPTVARAEVTVSGEDLSGILLTPLAPVVISGRVAFDGATAPPANLSSVRMPLPAVQLLGASAQIPLPTARLDAEGRFTMSVTPGPYRLVATVPGVRTPVGPWFLKSVVMNGRDILDAPLEFDQDADDLVVTFSDRASELWGRVVGTNGMPSPDSYVIVFSANRDTWFPNSRRVAAVKARDDGTFSIRNLPAGEYFATAADLDPGEWGDARVLEALSDGAVRLSLAETEKKTRDLRVR